MVAQDVATAPTEHHPKGMNLHRGGPSCDQVNTFTARAMTRPRISSDTSAWTVMAILAHGASGIASVGLNAVALVKPRYR